MTGFLLSLTLTVMDVLARMNGIIIDRGMTSEATGEQCLKRLILLKWLFRIFLRQALSSLGRDGTNFMTECLLSLIRTVMAQ